MAYASKTSGVVVWEWEERPSLWIPYEVDAGFYLEKSFLKFTQGTSKKAPSVKLENCSSVLSWYEVDLGKMEQHNKLGTGTIRKVKRTVYPSSSLCLGQGVRWEWHNDATWLAYDICTSEAIERQYRRDKNSFIDLSNTQLGIPNVLDFHSMEQINKHTHFRRPVRRLTQQMYPTDTQRSSVVRVLPSVGLNASAAVNGYAASIHTQSSKTAVTGKGVKTVSKITKSKRAKVEHSQAASAVVGDPLSQFCNDLETAPDEDCAICFEKLCNISSFDDESQNSKGAQTSSIKQLNKCKHSFHAPCLQAMYNSGTKDGSLQCPTCKAIHGIKLGIQPKDGVMDVHTSSRHLPGHPDCGMITITYDFRGGIQGPEHPNPGKRYQARGFPRTCYLPNNDKGKKVLDLLKEAWRRRLVFTIGTSTTTGEQDTVIWNEIHHKTEAFSNHMGHGYPDPNYLDNVLAELAAQGVQDFVETTII